MFIPLGRNYMIFTYLSAYVLVMFKRNYTKDVLIKLLTAFNVTGKY